VPPSLRPRSQTAASSPTPSPSATGGGKADDPSAGGGDGPVKRHAGEGGRRDCRTVETVAAATQLCAAIQNTYVVRDEEEGHAPERPLLSIRSTLSMVTIGFIAAHNSRKKVPTNKRMTWARMPRGCCPRRYGTSRTWRPRRAACSCCHFLRLRAYSRTHRKKDNL
jgi:hypothetical protein